MVIEIQFKLSTSKAEYLLGEPVICLLEVINVGSEPVSIIDDLDPESGNVNFYINNGTEDIFFVPFIVNDSIATVRLLNSYESIKGSAKLFYSGDQGWVFKPAGYYQIKATYQGIIGIPSKEIKSNEINLTIKPPKNEQEEEQVNLIMGEEQALFLLFQGGDHLTNGIEKLTEIIMKYPLSEIAGYANFALGMSYSQPFRDYRKGIVRRQDTLKALSYLSAAISLFTKDINTDDHCLTQSYFRIADLFHRCGNEVAEKDMLNEFVKKFSSVTRLTDSIVKAKVILNGENDWQRCNKCQGLTFTLSLSVGACPAGGLHDHSGSLNYTLVYTTGSVDGENDWQRCNKCQGLTFVKGESVGACPAGGLHDHSGSLNYTLVYRLI
jgi:hypothetical protein